MITNWLKRLILIACLLSTSAFTCSAVTLAQWIQQAQGIQATSTSQAALNAAVRATLDANLQALDNRDLAGYMAEIHPDSPAYAQTEALMGQVFASNRVLQYEYFIGDVTLLDNGDASVPFTLTTTRISGDAFRDNVVTGIWTMRLDGSQWKVYGQVVQNVRYLDNQPSSS